MRRSLPRLAAVTAATALGFAVTAGVAAAGTTTAQENPVPEPDDFTSMYTVMATPDTIVGNDGNAVPGEPGATGEFHFRINSDDEIICYDITLRGVTGEYQSPAKTATHIHEANAGEPGPPRLSFPDPAGDGDVRTSAGCLQGPFTTGLEGDNGEDTATGFSLAAIEANPAGFSADTHTADYTPGAVRGQLTQVPMGGVETGAGGTSAGPADTAGYALGAAGLATVAGAGVVLARRSRAGR
ncbi:CHRD domain-containing protein [Pseudonocardia ammonioxydans]|uniref:CHRD domain-containing protein n=1 Tax=Pseudonocardia ammonioxydans TaxID=260086 RepID=A0A1I5G5U6_PSUAM|nr:CHRD domain-containing protein [Pseudonocardia ammonioxydans]SFO31394.1 CHRD domain-containing protein [Pseudonocardia ammonioxydans]